MYYFYAVLAVGEILDRMLDVPSFESLVYEIFVSLPCRDTDITAVGNIGVSTTLEDGTDTNITAVVGINNTQDVDNEVPPPNECPPSS